MRLQVVCNFESSTVAIDGAVCRGGSASNSNGGLCFGWGKRELINKGCEGVVDIGTD